MDINFVLEKNGAHRPSSLGGRLIVVVSEWVRRRNGTKILRFDNFDSKPHLISCLNQFMVLIALYFMAVFWRKNSIVLYGSILKENIVVKLFCKCIFEEAIGFLVDPYY